MKTEVQKQDPCLFHRLGSKWHKSQLLEGNGGLFPPCPWPTVLLLTDHNFSKVFFSTDLLRRVSCD